MNECIEKLKGGVIVSCQSEGDDPFNQPQLLGAFAQSAQLGGAVGIRAQGIENIRFIRSVVDIPIIGLIRGTYEDNWALVTPDFSDIEMLMDAGADIVALDVTSRIRPNGMDGLEFFDEARALYNVPLMADISTFEEGVKAAELGADLVATTLSGYTEYTEKRATDNPDFELVKELGKTVTVPVIAEGRIWTPDQAKQAVEFGAYAVVVGTAITRPRIITRKFVSSVKLAAVRK